MIPPAVPAAAATLLLAAGLGAGVALGMPPPAQALPFARSCTALQAYINQVGRRMDPPVQVANLGDWYEADNTVACESGQVVRYFQSNTEVCVLQGPNRWPYTAVTYTPWNQRLKFRTAACTMLPPQPLPWLVRQQNLARQQQKVNPLAALSNLKAPGWGAEAPRLAAVLAGGLGALAWLGIRRRRRRAASSPLAGLLRDEEVRFLLDAPDPAPPAASPAAAVAERR